MQNRATRREDEQVHLGFMLSPSQDAPIAEVRDAVARLARVARCLSLGVLE